MPKRHLAICCLGLLMCGRPAAAHPSPAAHASPAATPRFSTAILGPRGGRLSDAQCNGLSEAPGNAPGATRDASDPWTLVWSDEFDDPDGSVPDPTKWTYDTGVGTNGWGNGELEYYTDRVPENVVVMGGNLVITALQETYTDPDGITRDYTSARLKTQGLFSMAYGRFEARIQIPYGQGLWPAFWMLGDDIREVGWPTCGEIDIMENIGREPSTVHGTIHGPGYSGGSGIGRAYSLPDGQAFADDFHLFAIEWEPDVIRFYVDDTLYKTTTPADLPAGRRWVFDHPFFLILNVAVGGRWPGPPDSSTVFPQIMLVDYVRVYERTSCR